LTDVWPVNVAALHGAVIGTSGGKWPCTSSGRMYCVRGRGIVADGCGSTAVAAKLIANERAPRAISRRRLSTRSRAMPQSGINGTR